MGVDISFEMFGPTAWASVRQILKQRVSGKMNPLFAVFSMHMELIANGDMDWILAVLGVVRIRVFAVLIS